MKNTEVYGFNRMHGLSSHRFDGMYRCNGSVMEFCCKGTYINGDRITDKRRVTRLKKVIQSTSKGIAGITESLSRLLY